MSALVVDACHRYVYKCESIYISEDCFYYCSERNNVVVLFGTLKVQSFILTEVSDCGLLIVVISSTFIYIYLHTCTHIHIYRNVHIHTFTYISIYMYTDTFTYMSIYIYEIT